MNLYANDLILFAHIVDAGSFTRASDLTGLPKSTLSRRLAELENVFGERLMQRSTRRLVLTEFGERMLEYARRLVDDTEAATALALHRQVTPQGILRVSFPPEYHELSLVQILSAFSRRHPDVRLDIDLSSRRVDLVAERFDVAVRVAAQLPDDNALVARRIITLHNGLYASPAYLALHGTPQNPSQLQGHTGLVLVTSAGDQQIWRLSRSNTDHWEGLPLRTLSANSVGLQQALAVQGLGIVGLSESFARPHVDRGELLRVLPQWHLPKMNVWCVTPGRKLLPQRTLAFIETLKEVLG
ncbi:MULTISPECIES: LysR family transcriptional regulator [unclassified Pusillimonas]|uniref:LysR family transcriptional regulator n=1 Tax=unclassified Pusillimonas TaxID=2640016 RepID=UPI000B9CAFC6|nr:MULTISPECIES: LysR family transcriptional regulator [unclassified Pusillimonas]OXR50021.1 LysR family transcriptional regulator [Pusillimonas sp. T2]ROT46849.1 LysR family transcriptional regulator [Pusillimonas sp. NJUB218]